VLFLTRHKYFADLSERHILNDISDHLEAISQAYNSVRVAAFADLSVQLVLAEATKAEIGQEHLDSMCVQTIQAFEGPLQSEDNPLISQTTEVATLQENGVLISLRTDIDSTSALFLLCDFDIDVEGVVEMSRLVLHEMEAI